MAGGGSRITQMSSWLTFFLGLKVAERMGEGTKEDNGKEKREGKQSFGTKNFLSTSSFKEGINQL